MRRTAGKVKAQIGPTIKAHLIRGASYLFLFLGMCLIPFALAQRNGNNHSLPPEITTLSRNAGVSSTNRALVNPDEAPAINQTQLSDLRAHNKAPATSTITSHAPRFNPTGGCVPAPWTTANTGPRFRYRAGAVTDGTYVYVFGGAPGFLNDLWRWDPATQTWTQLANMPTGKQNIQGAYWNGKIYVPGGYDSTGQHVTENAIYDIATNTWGTGAPLPAPQTGQNVAFSGKIYNFGGNPGPQDTVTIYDISSDTWSNGQAMPAAIVYGRATVAGPYAYYAGGILGGTTTTNTLYRYDFASNTWTTMAPLQTARTSEELMPSPDSSKLFAVMGGDSTFFTGIPLPLSVEIYDIASDMWSYGNAVVTKAAAPAGGLAGGKAVVQGGVDGPTYYDTVQLSLVPCGGTPTATPTVSPSPSQTPTPGPCQFRVLLVFADDFPTQLQSEIQAEPNVIAVDLFYAAGGTPTLGQLQQYQIVVPFSNSAFLDADTLGNNLADYVDGGGIVVQYGFSFYGPCCSPYGINGRWLSDGYSPFEYTQALWEGGPFGLGTFNAGHPLMVGVTALNSDLANVPVLAAGATEVAQMNIGGHLVAFRPVSGGHTTVGVSAYVGAQATQSGDWGKVIVNAGNWLRVCGGTPTPTATPTPTPCTGRCTPTPRPRPTPAPRP